MSLQYFILLSCLFLFKATGQTTIGFETTTLAAALNTVSTNVTEEINTSCSDGEWQCENGDCISNTTWCDGSIDCEDGSDENRKTCNGSDSRPLFGLLLHCMSWSDNHEKVCPQICHDAPEFCYYALIAENERSQGLCVFPEYPKHGSYKIIPYKNENSSTSNSFRLKYACVEPFVMVESEKHECINGTWRNHNDNRYCSEACELGSYKNDNFTFTCPEDIDGNVTCNDYVAINSTVNVRKIYEDPDDEKSNKKTVTVKLFCPPTKEINISTSCVDEVENKQQAFESPTMTKMTQYEADFNKFKPNDNSSEFNQLVHEFNKFEQIVRKELDEMHEMAEECDISLDLLLSHLQRKKIEQGIEN